MTDTVTIEGKKYITKKVLGSGAKGVTYLIEDSKGKQFAAKRITKEPGEFIDINTINDFVIPMLLSCQDNMACIYSASEDEDYYWILSKYYEGSQELTIWPIPDQTTKLGQIVLIELMQIIADAIARIHEAGVAHRDIKPENILYQEYNTHNGISYLPIIIDFDLSCIQDPNLDILYDGRFTCHGSPGTLPYAAPELFNASVRNYYKSDVHSLGVVFYELANRKKHPFIYADPKLNIKIPKMNFLAANILYGNPNISNHPNEDLNELIGDMLIKDPEGRPSARVVSDRLMEILVKHYW